MRLISVGIYSERNLRLRLPLPGRSRLCYKKGKTARLIAEELFISPRTVETHLQRLKEKLGCRCKSELIVQLLQLNL